MNDKYINILKEYVFYDPFLRVYIMKFKLIIPKHEYTVDAQCSYFNKTTGEIKELSIQFYKDKELVHVKYNKFIFNKLVNYITMYLEDMNDYEII